MHRWRARLGARHDDASLARGLALAAGHAALVARRRDPAGWLAAALADARAARPAESAALLRRVAELPEHDAAEPGFHLFEHLLAACDADTREAVGAYYTPVELVAAQVALVEEALRRHGLDWTAPDLAIVDPACGTGVYPHTLAVRVRERLGPAALPALARNLHAHELLPGPAIVAHGQLAAAGLPDPRVDCRDTLHSLCTDPADAPLVVLGNPPYSRHAPRGSAEHLLAGFLPPAGAGVHAKNLYNDYVYFWRWALAAAFERRRAPGVVCFVTAASWLRGPAFEHMRAHVRGLVDELHIIDLGGDALGSRRSANIFKNVRIPVCVGLAVRGGRPATAARVHYTRLGDELDGREKLTVLAGVRSFADLAWTRVDDPDVVVAVAGQTTDPRLTDLFPWQHSGAQFKRTWPVGETRELLERRWRALLAAPDRAAAFRETRDRTVDRAAPPLPDPRAPTTSTAAPIAALPVDAPAPPLARYAFRSFDRRWCLADARLGDFLRPPLWATAGDRQVFLTTLLSDTPSSGPAIVAAAAVPDLHHYSGRGGADVLPLYRDAAGREPNVTPGLLDLLARAYGHAVDADDLCAYVLACAAHPAYTATLREPGPRVPLSRDPQLFAAAVALGRELLNVHTFGERMDPGRGPLTGRARCTRAVGEAYPQNFDCVDGELVVGDGRFAPVDAHIYAYSVSGLHVVASWLGYRMQAPRGRASSPLDALRPARWTAAMSDELLALLWTLEQLVAREARQADLLARILAGPRFTAAELPSPPAASRRPP
jgi:hypothetical protein